MIKLDKQSEVLKKIREEAANLKVEGDKSQKNVLELLSAATSSYVRGESIAFHNLQRNLDDKEQEINIQITKKAERLLEIEKHLPMKEPMEIDLHKLIEKAGEKRIDLRNITGRLI